MHLIKLNTRTFRVLCTLFGLMLAYYGYKQIPTLTEPTLGLVERSADSGFSEVLGSLMLIMGSFIASFSTIFESIYAIRKWNNTKRISAIFNFIFATIVFFFIVFLTWPGFKWALIATIVICLAYLINKMVQCKIH